MVTIGQASDCVLSLGYYLGLGFTARTKNEKVVLVDFHYLNSRHTLNSPQTLNSHGAIVAPPLAAATAAAAVDVTLDYRDFGVKSH
jgi:hypothetical protein